MSWNYVRREKEIATSSFFLYFYAGLTSPDLSFFPLKMGISTENLSI